MDSLYSMQYMENEWLDRLREGYYLHCLEVKLVLES